MVEKKIGRNTGGSGRVNVSGSELDQLGLAVGSAVDVAGVDIMLVEPVVDRVVLVSGFLGVGGGADVGGDVGHSRGV